MAISIKDLSEVQRFILTRLDEHPRDIAKVTAQHFGITRQAANRQLRRLVELGVLRAEGETRSRQYYFAVIGKNEVVLPITPELQEDVVWRQHVAPILAGVPANVFDICHYGITEMVNNAIDHSASPDVSVSITYTAGSIDMMVWDRGVGILRKIKEAYNLEDERHAILELVKGKLTTDPERHTGEGIFFTSRVFDTFGILSAHLYLGHRREGEDWLLEDRTQYAEGTSVHMTISPLSTHTDKEVFERYSSEQDDYAFSRTHVVVALAQPQEEGLVSRSQAKRVMARLNRFKAIVLDFKGVKKIGAAFADEMFRVFRAEHPQITVTSINANDEVTRMIRRALRGGEPEAVGNGAVG